MSDVIPLIIADSNTPISGFAMTLARELIARLEYFYPTATALLPNGAWRVMVNEPGGIIQVQNISIPTDCGFLMKIKDIDPEGRKVVRYGGELLERFRLSRGGLVRVRMEQIQEAPRNFRRQLVADL